MVEFRHGNDALLGTLDQAGQRAVGAEGRLPRQELIKNEAQRKDVGALVQVLRQRLLGRHIFHGADHGAGLGHAFAFQRLGQAKIHNQDAARLFAHDVLRLQITVDDAHIVCGGQRPAHLLDDNDCFMGRKLGSLVEDVGEILAIDILHGDELYAFCFAQVIDTNDVAVGDLGGEDELLLESVKNRAIASQVRAYHFEGD